MDLPKQLEKASEAYAKHALLRATINAIPFVGGSLDVLFASKGQAIIQKRIFALFEGLQKELNNYQEELIDRDYLESEEWLDLVMKAIESSAKTRSQEKIQLYAKVLRGSVTVQNRQESSPEEYLAVLAELTTKELEVARVIYKQQKDGPLSGENELQWANRTGWLQLQDQCPSIPKSDYQFILLRLQRSGLIREITGAYYDYTGGIYVITDAFRKLMGYIDQAGGRDN